MNQRRRDRVVGRVAGGKIQIWGSSPTGVIFFLTFFSKSSAFAEGGGFFCQKNSVFF